MTGSHVIRFESFPVTFAIVKTWVISQLSSGPQSYKQGGQLTLE